MTGYNVKCPVCGKVNVGLDLEETDGWMECDGCGSITQSQTHKKPSILIPLHRVNQLQKMNDKEELLATRG